MHSNKALTSRLFQYVNMTRRIMDAISDKPDDQAEWLNISQLMYHLRQALACSTCGTFVLSIYTPVQEPCHCICANCRDDGSQASQSCATCRHAYQTSGPDGFEINKDLQYTALGFAKSCKLLIDKDIIRKWSTLQVDTLNGPITFGQLVGEGYCSECPDETQNLSDKFRKKVKEKPHHCRCGSGSKKGDSRTSGNLTCLGQRCACYRKSKLLSTNHDHSSLHILIPSNYSTQHRQRLHQLQVRRLQEPSWHFSRCSGLQVCPNRSWR